MDDSALWSNPDADVAAEAPRIGRHRVNGTSLYAEVRGTGPAILLIPGGAEDAEGWRPVADGLSGHTVVTYDRRGTLRSGREDWPGAGSAQHADDAAGLLRAIGLHDVVLAGASSGGIVALQLALRHPALVRRVLVYEPGYLRCVRGGNELRRRVSAAAAEHLEHHPGDWAGAWAAFLQATASTAPSATGGFLATRAVNEWYARREEGNAEAFLRDDLPILTAESVDGPALARLSVEVRFSHGTNSPAVFRAVTSHLAAIRHAAPDVLERVGHALYLHPDVAAAYIRRLSS